MAQEDYCSYEVAKLLKEKGFDEPCRSAYIWNTEEYELCAFFSKLLHFNREGGLEDYEDDSVPRISAPTHQMAMRWLREEHEIDIIPIIRHSLKYAQESPFRDYACRVYDCDGNIVLSATKWYSRYENAVEAALKYTLENLI